MKTILIIGGGAAGFFAAINCAEKNPDYKVIILEKSPKLLAKVEVSGGGRCNVTHCCFDVRQLVKNYPRGEKQLIGPFTRFNPTHTIDWFHKRGVSLKTEADNRMFPKTDSSQTIINCFLNEAQRLGVEIKTQCGLASLKKEDDKWLAITTAGAIKADAIIITAGSSQQMWKLLQTLGLNIVTPVPSLFTFNIKNDLLTGLLGLSVANATVSIQHPNFKTQNSSGPLLITHWGLSGPAVLRLSAWAARELASVNYNFDVLVNWTGSDKANQVIENIQQYKNQYPKQSLAAHSIFEIPSRLWLRLLTQELEKLRFGDLSNKQIAAVANRLSATQLRVTGKSTFKDEFVTAGGVDLSEIDFKTMQSKKFQGLYFAGEVLDIDAITGGFNFQAAWTTGFIAGTSV